ncbi:MAG: glycerol-3-phosphate 1-O-acyltransferase PlsY [Limisphaerales bacterium]
MLTSLVVTAVAAYILGSIPTGYLVGRARGLDLRALGSGNIGATNALRVLGRGPGTFVLIVDALKGFLACTLVPHLVQRALGPAWASVSPAILPVVGGTFAVLGHNFTIWLRFKGGKGVATSAGVLAGLLPVALAVVLAVFLFVLAVSRWVSLGSLAAAAALPPVTWVIRRDPVLLGFAVVLAVLVFWRHRANIHRLWAGTEPRIGARKPPAP